MRTVQNHPRPSRSAEDLEFWLTRSLLEEVIFTSFTSPGMSVTVVATT